MERYLLRQTITYSEAVAEETDILHELGYLPRQDAFFDDIYRRRSLLADVVAHHLGISSSMCQIANKEDWLHGSFNLCIPFTIENSSKVLIRFPLPYRVGDSFCPGNSAEKVRCEAGTYAWLQQECPTVRTPHLYGFALSAGKVFTSVEHLPLFTRLSYHLRCWVRSLLRAPVPSRFVQHINNTLKDIRPYLLLEYIEDGQMLSHTWKERHGNKKLRENLFRGLSRIMLSLSHIALPKIGSFIIDDNGFLHLANRPLTQELQSLENGHIPIDIPRLQPFFSADSYVNSLLSCHDNRLRYQPNAIKSAGDCAFQMTALALMRTVRHHFFEPNFNHGPFVFCLTDLHASNIFVDQDWNVRCIVDLEWAATFPLEFLQTPYWLSDQAIDMIDSEVYDTLREEFMSIFEAEEDLQCASYDLRRADIMKAGWERGTFWYILALQNPMGLHTLFYDRILPLYSKKHRESVPFITEMCSYWTQQTSQFIKAKFDDRAAYEKKLLAEFSQTT